MGYRMAGFDITAERLSVFDSDVSGLDIPGFFLIEFNATR